MAQILALQSLEDSVGTDQDTLSSLLSVWCCR